MAKKITWLEAAEIIGVCDRTLRRMRERYQEFGYDGLFDQRRRKRSYLRVPMETAERVLALYRDTYFELSVRHFHEKPRERAGDRAQLPLGKGTVKKSKAGKNRRWKDGSLSLQNTWLCKYDSGRQPRPSFFRNDPNRPKFVSARQEDEGKRPL